MHILFDAVYKNWESVTKYDLDYTNSRSINCEFCYGQPNFQIFMILILKPRLPTFLSQIFNLFLILIDLVTVFEYLYRQLYNDLIIIPNQAVEVHIRNVAYFYLFLND